MSGGQLITGGSQGKKRGFTQPHLGAASEVITDRVKPLLFLENGMVVKIKGFRVLVDPEYASLAREKGWCLFGRANAYFHRTRKRKGEYLHHLIAGASDRDYVDHINKNTLDNRKSNLRICTPSENRIHSKKPIHNTSGFKCVSRDKGRNLWRVRVGFMRKKYSLSGFASPEDAWRAAMRLAKEIAGGFADES